MSDHSHEGLYAGVIFAVGLSAMALFIAIGPCVQQEDVVTKVEHLERRIDNLRDRP